MEPNYFTILYCFCHTLTRIHHRFTCVPHPEPPIHLPPHRIPLGHPSAPAQSTLSHASNLDWRSISHMIIYMFQCHSPKTSHPHTLPQSPKDCSIHLCLFCCLTYRVIVTIFLNSIYMCYCCCCCYVTSAMSDSVWPHRRQPTRLPHPWDSPGKNTGVGCHFLLQCMKVKSESEVTQSCPTLSDPMDCNLPGSSIHRIFQARVLEWGATAFSDMRY